MAISNGLQVTKDVDVTVYCGDCEEVLNFRLRQSVDGDKVRIYVDHCAQCQRERDGDD